MTLCEFQRKIEETYGERDRARGVDGTFRWFVEEVGELAKALRSGNRRELELEFADAAAWLFTLANLTGVEMEDAVEKYRNGCPKCLTTPCACE